MTSPTTAKKDSYQAQNTHEEGNIREQEEKVHDFGPSQIVKANIPIFLYYRAKTSFKEGKYSEAMDKVFEVLSTGTQDSSLLGKLSILLGRANLAVGNLSGAKLAFQNAAQFRPEHERVGRFQEELFETFLKQNKKDKAFQYAEELLSSEDTFSPLKFALRERQYLDYLTSYQVEKAKASVKVGLQENPKNESLQALNEWFEFMEENCPECQIYGYDDDAISKTFTDEDARKEESFIGDMLKKYPKMDTNTQNWFLCRRTNCGFYAGFRELVQNSDNLKAHCREGVEVIKRAFSQTELLPEVRAEWYKLGALLSRFYDRTSAETFLEGMKSGFSEARYAFVECLFSYSVSIKERTDKLIQAIEQQTPSPLLDRMVSLIITHSLYTIRLDRAYQEKNDGIYQDLQKLIEDLIAQHKLSTKIFPVILETYIDKSDFFKSYYPQKEQEDREIRLSSLLWTFHASLSIFRGDHEQAKTSLEEYLTKVQDENDLIYIQEFMKTNRLS